MLIAVGKIIRVHYIIVTFTNKNWDT